MTATTHTLTATHLRSALDALRRPLERVLPQDVGLPAGFDAWAANRAAALAGILERAGAAQPAAFCTHPGALGPCMPRIADGRCIWCERELTRQAGGVR